MKRTKAGKRNIAFWPQHPIIAFPLFEGVCFLKTGRKKTTQTPDHILYLRGFLRGTDGVRTHDLSRVRRTLIPAELPFHDLLPHGKTIIVKKYYWKKKGNLAIPFFVRKMGLEPTRCNQHKILSLARLPIPTLPHALPKRKMQEMGLEPTLCCHNRHLKPARLPFRHSCAQIKL